LWAAPAICDSNSRAVNPAIRIPTEHHPEVQLPELAGLFSLELRKIPDSGHETPESSAAAAICRDPHHGQTLPDAVTADTGQRIIPDPLAPGKVFLELNRHAFKEVLQALKAVIAQSATAVQIIEKCLMIWPAMYQLRPEG
jgi:hypothetical protein